MGKHERGEAVSSLSNRSEPEPQTCRAMGGAPQSGVRSITNNENLPHGQELGYSMSMRLLNPPYWFLRGTLVSWDHSIPSRDDDSKRPPQGLRQRLPRVRAAI